MDKNVILSSLLFLVVTLFGCIKKDYPPECQPRELTDIQKSNLVGKWHWYKTDIEQWFDIGPSNFYQVTPQSEGFEYYFTISEDGKFKGYQNDTLIHEWIFNKTSYQNIDGDTVKTITFNLDCTNLTLSFLRLPYSYNLDTLDTQSYPIRMNDEQNHLRSHSNYFRKE